MLRTVESGRIYPYLVGSVATTVVVVALAAWLLDDRDFGTFGEALWWSAQTVSTVGYGDVPVESVTGRLLGIVVMVAGVTLISVLSATLTSGLVATLQARLAREQARTHATLDDVLAALEGIEKRLAELERR